MKEKQSKIIVIVFLVMIFSVTLATVLKPSRKYSEKENRSLQLFPKLSLSTIFSGKFEEEYESYLTDQFIFRDSWISLKTGVERAIQKKDINDVYFADDNYLIEKHSDTFTTKQAEANVAQVGAFFQKMTETYGADHVTAMVVPNAVDILRDKLPALAAPYDEETYLTKIQAALPAGVWFDSSSVLRAHKNEEIYYRTDHHWKTLGAFYVFQAWAKEQGLADVSESDYTVRTVTEDFEGTVSAKVGSKAVPDSIEVYEAKDPVDVTLKYNQSDKDMRTSLYDESKLETHDKYGYFLGGNFGLIEIKTSEAKAQTAAESKAAQEIVLVGPGKDGQVGEKAQERTGRRILVIKDSYAHCFVPFLMNEYDEVDLLDLRYFNQSLSEFMASKDYTDILFLYNASGFASETCFVKLGA